MASHLVLRGQLHRVRYAPGSTVKCAFSVRCTDKPIETARGTIAPHEVARLDEKKTVDMNAPPALEIISFCAQFMGCCVVDTSRIRFPGHEQSVTDALQINMPDALGSHDEAHQLFSSPVVEPLRNKALRLHESQSGTVTCLLPPRLPPTYRGQCARFYYGVHLSCLWMAEGKRKITTLRVPIKLSSPVSALVILRSPYVSPDFDFCLDSVSFPAAPDPTVASPLSDALRVEEETPSTGQKGGLFVSHTLDLTLENSSRPTDYCIRCQQVPVLSMILMSSAVALGDSLRGVFVTIPNQEYVCAMVTVTVESVETVPRHLFASGSILPSGTHLVPDTASGEEHVVTESRVVDEGDYVLLNAAQLPFSFSISPSKYTQTLKTELLCVSWQLRVRFWMVRFGEAFNLNRCVKQLVGPAQQLEVPITIFSSRGTQHPQVGPALYAT